MPSQPFRKGDRVRVDPPGFEGEVMHLEWSQGGYQVYVLPDDRRAIWKTPDKFCRVLEKAVAS